LTNKQLERSWQWPWGDSRVLIEMFTGDSGDAAEDHLFWRKRDLSTFWRKHMEFNWDLRKEFKLLECQSLYEDRSTRNYHQEKYFLQPILVFWDFLSIEAFRNKVSEPWVGVCLHFFVIFASWVEELTYNWQTYYEQLFTLWNSLIVVILYENSLDNVSGQVYLSYLHPGLPV